MSLLAPSDGMQSLRILLFSFSDVDDLIKNTSAYWLTPPSKGFGNGEDKQRGEKKNKWKLKEISTFCSIKNDRSNINTKFEPEIFIWARNVLS